MDKKVTYFENKYLVQLLLFSQHFCSKWINFEKMKLKVVSKVFMAPIFINNSINLLLISDFLALEEGPVK